MTPNSTDCRASSGNVWTLETREQDITLLDLAQQDQTVSVNGEKLHLAPGAMLKFHFPAQIPPEKTVWFDEKIPGRTGNGHVRLFDAILKIAVLRPGSNDQLSLPNWAAQVKRHLGRWNMVFWTNPTGKSHTEYKAVRNGKLRVSIRPGEKI